jgi:hypothetical protein
MLHFAYLGLTHTGKPVAPVERQLMEELDALSE